MAAERKLGQERGVGFAIVLAIITLGIYWFYWTYKTYEELKQYRGTGLDPFPGILVSFVGITIFLLPAYIGRMYREDGQRAPVSGWTGFWAFFPYVGGLVWIAKLQGALNDFWR